jgi:hypothetical protein
MDKNEVQALIRESMAPVLAENASLRAMLTTVKGKSLVEAKLESIRLPDAAKRKIAEAIAPSIPMDATGNVDDAKLTQMVESQAKDWAETLSQLGVATNPAAFGTRVTEAEVLATAEALDTEHAEVMEGLANLFVGPKLVKGSIDEAARQARKDARKSFVEGRVA